MKLRKETERFERTLGQIEEVTRMLKAEGEYDGKSRYLEIMATILLFIEESLRVIRGFFAVGFGLLLGLLLSSLIKSL